MSQAALGRLAALIAAIACGLIAFGLLPGLKTATELTPAPTLIDNDISEPVVVVHCEASCPAGGGTIVKPGHQIPAGPPHATWQVRSESGTVIGCLWATAAGQRMPVSGAAPCPT